MKISIADEVRSTCPGAALGILAYAAKVSSSSQVLLDQFEAALVKLQQEYTLETIALNPHIAATRQAYKALGKSPHEYRSASEAMLRRIVKGSGLYHINNVIEVNNLISVSSGYSIGSYDAGQLNGELELLRAEEGTHYDGIGKDSVNIGYLPVLYDRLGPFGNPSCDSRRAMVQPGRREVLSVIFSFDGGDALDSWIKRYAQDLKEYCGVSGIEKWIVLNGERWHVLAPILVVLAGVFWGMIGLFSHALSESGLSALQIAELRCLITAVALTFAMLLTQRELLKIRLRDVWLFIGTGVCSIAFFNVCYFICISQSTLSIACILLYTSPCFVMLLSCLFFHERFTKQKMAAIFLAFSGCVLITGVIGGGGARVSGFALAAGLCSGFGYALYSIIGRIALARYNWLTVITYTFLAASASLLPFCRPLEIVRVLAAGNAAISNAVLLGILSTLLPFLLYTKGLEHMETGKAALLTFVEPMVATIISAAVFHESFTLDNAVGIVLIVLSIVVLSYVRRSKNAACDRNSSWR